jgi:uncharacterized membrane protein
METEQRPAGESRRRERPRRGPDARLAQGLGVFSLGLGLAEALAPGQLARLIGLPDGRRVLRTFGFREMASGAGILTQRRPAGWMWARVGGDALDLAMLGAALVAPGARRGRIALAAGAVAGVAALDVLCARQLTRRTQDPLHVVHATTLNKPVEEVYRWWRDVENLPRVMKHLESVRRTDERRSHWVATGPAGRKVEWDAEITDDRPNTLIAWRSLPGAAVWNAGTVRFEPAPTGRGTVLRVDMRYRPPGGMAAPLFATVFGEEPSQQVREDLRRMKQLLETGEVPTTEGQPSGRASGRAAATPARRLFRRMPAAAEGGAP